MPEEAQDTNHSNDAKAEASAAAASTSAHEETMAASTGGPSVLSRFTLAPDFGEALAGVKKRIAVVQVMKPKRTWWFRVNPEYHLDAALLLDESSAAGRESYLVAPELVQELGDDVVPTSLFGAMSRQGVFFVLPVRLPGTDGRLDSWNMSMREAVALAEKQAVRAASNRDAGCYDVFVSAKAVEFPAWPQESWDELLAIAFKDKIVETLDHPVLRRLRGEI